MVGALLGGRSPISAAGFWGGAFRMTFGPQLSELSSSVGLAPTGLGHTSE